MKTLHIVDITAWAFRCIHAAPPLTNSRGVPTGGAYLFARTLTRAVQTWRPSHLVAVWDAPARSFRKDLYAGYKAGRAPLDETIKIQLKLARAVVRALPLPVLQAPGVEADDVIATLVRRFAAEGHAPIVVSPDKDLLQLVGPAQVLNPMTGFVTEDDVRQKFGVAPGQIRDLLALAGDAADGVPGVEGIGPGTAAKLLREHGDLDGVVRAAAGLRGKRGAALRAAAADGTLDLWRRLVTLKDDVELPVASIEDLALPPPDDRTRRFLFERLEFRSMTSDFPTEQELYDAAGRPTVGGAP